MDCKVGTIREIQRHLARDGYNISEYALRQWVKEGKLHAVYTGNKALIKYEQVLNLFIK